MVRVKELVRLLNGVDPAFEIDGIDTAFVVDLKAKRLHISPDLQKYTVKWDPKLRGFESQGGKFAQESNTRFFPQGGGWTEENEMNYEAWKDGELEPEEHNPDYGTNTVPS